MYHQDQAGTDEISLSTTDEPKVVSMTNALATDSETKPPPVPEHKTIPPDPPAKDPLVMEIAPKEPEEHRLRSENAKLKTQLSQLNQKYTQSEQERLKLRKDHELLEKKYDSFCAKASEKMQEADERADKAEMKQHEWQIEARTIAEELAQCKDELFNLQPQNEVTDTHVAGLWDTLCQQITRWVDDEAEFGSELLPRLKDLQSHGQLSELVLKYWGPDRQLTVGRWKMNDDLDCVLRYNIHCLLENYVFDESVYFFGLTESDKRLLQLIEGSMANLKPPRDQGSIDHWRSEALNAMYGLPTFKEVQGGAANSITREAENSIAPLLPKLSKDAWKRFHAQITLPAIEFSSIIRQSPVRYYFLYPHVQSGSPRVRQALTPKKKPRAINESELEQINLLDVESRKTLMANQTQLAATKDGIIGDEIFLIHPALARKKGEGEQVILRKPLELVKLITPLPRKKKPGVVS